MHEYLLVLLANAVVFALIFYYLKTAYQKKVKETFQSLSYEITEKNNQSFIRLASSFLENEHSLSRQELEERQKKMELLFSPLKDSLEKILSQNKEMEKQREGAYVSLQQQIHALMDSEEKLYKETSQLAKALKSPNVRGSWGQLHLKRVVELAGLLEHCDFSQEVSSQDRTARPDLIVHLPQNRQVIIDAKTPIHSYLEAYENENESVRKMKFKEHASHVKRHIKQLGAKEYWKQFTLAPEYVILFLPSEALFSTALNEDPTLLERGAELNVVLATPSTLIAILRAIAMSWNQEKMSNNAKEIAEIGKELYERIKIMNDHFQKLGKNLSSSVDSYNQTLASLESRVFVSARKLKNYGIGKDELIEKDGLEKTVKTLN